MELQSETAWMLGLRGSNPADGLDVRLSCSLCVVQVASRLCDGLIICPKGSYRVCVQLCVIQKPQNEAAYTRLGVCVKTFYLCLLRDQSNLKLHTYLISRSQQPRGLRRTSAAARLLRLWVRIPPGAWMFVCCERCVLSDRGLCDELITRPEESYRMWCVIVCDLETS